MKLRHITSGIILLGTLALLCSMWWPEAESPLSPRDLDIPTTIDPDAITPSPIPIPRPVNRRTHEECETCPSMLAVSEGWKRSGPEAVTIEASHLEDDDCFRRLRKAAAEGIPNVNSQDLGGCDDRTPLHLAATSDQVRDLLSAGADVNAQDEYGNTALHSHAAPFRPTEDSLEIIEMLLAAGADPRIEDEQGVAPWKHSLLHSHTVPGHLVAHETIARKADEEGMPINEFLSWNPRYQERLDSLMDGYLIEARIQRRLLSAAVGQSMSATIR